MMPIQAHQPGKPVIRLISLFLLLLLPGTLRAENPPGGGDDILRPVPFTLHVGPYAGFGWVASNGTFETVCQCAYEGGGNGLGFQFGGFVDYPLSGDVSLMTTLGLRTIRASHEKNQTRIEFLRFPPDDGEFMNVDFTLESVVQMTLVELGVYGKWDLAVRGLYVAAGGEFAIVIDDNIEETERISTPGITYVEGGGTQQTSMNDPLSRYYDDTGYRLAAAVKLGYLIPITPAVSLAPELSLSFPLTPIVAEFQDWRMTVFHAQLYLRFAL